MEEVIKKFKH